MGDIIKHANVPRKIFESKSEIVKAGMYKDEQEVLQWLLQKQAEQKTSLLWQKNSRNGSKNTIWIFRFLRTESTWGRWKKNLKNLDDLTLWEGYVKAYKYWKQYLQL